MKKALVLVMVLVLAAAMIAGCSGGASGGSADDVKGEMYDAGSISALVPEGCMAFPTSDLFDEYEGDNDPTSFSIYKGAESEWDSFVKPGVQISYYAPDAGFMSAKDWYDDVQDIEAFDLGNFSWTGYTGSSLEVPVTVLEGTSDAGTVQLIIMTEMDDGKIALEDADVQAIIKSVAITA